MALQTSKDYKDDEDATHRGWKAGWRVQADKWRQLILCPITGRPCEGDLAYLCPEYGCARKGGLSPRSEENF
jgi:hypothetical protein